MERTRIRKIKKTSINFRNHNFIYLLFFILFIIITSYIIYNFPPNHNFNIINLSIPVFPFFLIFLSLSIFSLFTFLFIRKLQGFLFSAFILFYIFLKLLGLTHFIFAILLIALFITIQIFIFKKK